MKIKSLYLKDKIVKNNLFFAPMAGYTDCAVREIMLSLGAGFCFTELVSAKGLVYGGEGSRELLETVSYENTAAQIFGAEPFFMRSACESNELRPFSVIDINMGCPVPKVYKNGEGSALLTDIKKSESIIKECVKSGKIITVKIRTGLKKGDDLAKEYCIMAENSGASLVTIHGRVRESFYSGEPDYNAIERAKSAVKIPIIANGGIFTVDDANLMIGRTGADGVMLARGALSNPFLFSALSGKAVDRTLKDIIFEHLDREEKRYGEKTAAVNFRKFVPYYFKGERNAKNLKMYIYATESVVDIKNAVDDYLK